MFFHSPCFLRASASVGKSAFSPLDGLVVIPAGAAVVLCIIRVSVCLAMLCLSGEATGLCKTQLFCKHIIIVYQRKVCQGACSLVLYLFKYYIYAYPNVPENNLYS